MPGAMLGACPTHCETHVLGAMHERTNELTYAEPPTNREKAEVSNAHAHVGQVYIVHWATPGFTKVGFCVDENRWHPYVRRGGRLLGFVNDTERHPTMVELDMHAILVRRRVPRAFDTKADAAPYLGHRGAGWTECYVDVSGRDVLGHLIDEMARKRA